MIFCIFSINLIQFQLINPALIYISTRLQCQFVRGIVGDEKTNPDAPNTTHPHDPLILNAETAKNFAMVVDTIVQEHFDQPKFRVRHEMR